MKFIERADVDFDSIVISVIPKHIFPASGLFKAYQLLEAQRGC